MGIPFFSKCLSGKILSVRSSWITPEKCGQECAGERPEVAGITGIRACERSKGRIPSNTYGLRHYMAK